MAYLLSLRTLQLFQSNTKLLYSSRTLARACGYLPIVAQQANSNSHHPCAPTLQSRLLCTTTPPSNSPPTPPPTPAPMSPPAPASTTPGSRSEASQSAEKPVGNNAPGTENKQKKKKKVKDGSETEGKAENQEKKLSDDKEGKKKIRKRPKEKKEEGEGEEGEKYDELVDLNEGSEQKGEKKVKKKKVEGEEGATGEGGEKKAAGEGGEKKKKTKKNIGPVEKGNIMAYQSAFQESVKYYTEAIDNPSQITKGVTLAEVLLRRSACNQRLGNVEASRNDLVRITEVVDKVKDLETFQSAQAKIAYSYMSEAKTTADPTALLTKAITAFTQALESKPNDKELIHSRGLANLRLQNYNTAMADFSKTVEVDPGFAPAYFGRADCSLATKNYGEAIKEFTKYIEVHTPFYEAEAKKEEHRAAEMKALTKKNTDDKKKY